MTSDSWYAAARAARSAVPILMEKGLIGYAEQIARKAREYERRGDQERMRESSEGGPKDSTKA